MDTETWNEFRAAYIQKIRQDSRGVGKKKKRDRVKAYSKVEDAIDYAAAFGGSDASDEWYEQARNGGTSDIQQALREMADAPEDGLRGFCRRYPARDQDVAVVLTNPKLDFNKLDGSDNARLAKITNPKTRMQESADTSYFAQGRNGTDIRNALADAFELDGVPNPYPEDADIAAGLEANGDWTTRDWEDSPSWIDHIYHTNYYKFATSSSETVPKWAGDVWFVSCMLSWELETVNPDVVFSFGKETWEYYFRQRVEWHPRMDSDEPLPSVERLGVEQATGCRFINPDTGRTVLVSRHPSFSTANFTDPTAGTELPASK